jgi:hypothetical protein
MSFVGLVVRSTLVIVWSTILAWHQLVFTMCHSMRLTSICLLSSGVHYAWQGPTDMCHVALTVWFGPVMNFHMALRWDPFLTAFYGGGVHFLSWTNKHVSRGTDVMTWPNLMLPCGISINRLEFKFSSFCVSRLYSCVSLSQFAPNVFSEPIITFLLIWFSCLILLW